MLAYDEPIHSTSNPSRWAKCADFLNQLMASLSGEVPPEDALKEFLGHTPLQVCFGALLGLCVALLLG